MFGTWRWIMNGITLMPAPTMLQTPVATSPSRPMSRASRVSATNLRPRSAVAEEDRLGRAIDVAFGGRPVRDRDPHHLALLPDSAAGPARAVCLDSRDDVTRGLVGIPRVVSVESNQHLV